MRSCAQAARPDSASGRSSSRAAPRTVGGRVAIPGERTTAALLLRLLGRFETVPMRFDRIEQAVLRGDVDCGVLIHEGRFTYQAKGLALLADLGAVWEERMKCPLPLAAIAIRRDLAALHGSEVDRALRASVEYAFAHPDASREYVAAHAQEMDPAVVAQAHRALRQRLHARARRARGARAARLGSRNKDSSRSPAARCRSSSDVDVSTSTFD